MEKREYLQFMENEEESVRLERKTDAAAVRSQALWSGIRPGMRVLDAGCGPGITTAILHEMVQPGGEAWGLDYSEQRITFARARYGQPPGIRFQVHDLRRPLPPLGEFDIVWLRFVLEYNLGEGLAIVQNLAPVLKRDGWLCLMDLDHNCLCHYELPAGAEEVVRAIMERLQQDFNFDPYAGRKLYSYLYDASFRDIAMDLLPHHLIYGTIGVDDSYNWSRKLQAGAVLMADIAGRYPGGVDAFVGEMQRFLHDPRRLIYTPLILCKGRKPAPAVSGGGRGSCGSPG
jgi:SAM-dependent methyltransferase